jgi:hypothetical protein
VEMEMKKKYSEAGKGDKSRVKDKKKYDKNYDRIFKPKMFGKRTEQSNIS